ncbi:hypothetical protein OOK39_31515 [Streptomyces sp. NBC_00264]|uniref:hypothetical protein n=1 Tax=unclassified Streptomyces TaxID=2593676 RepID=UPI002252B221|nr:MULTISPECIES: hypothetical protein [unclassified Streptomyces]MCX5163762.1 hypothetical protein [Streptomyces sp. NBC_00305]MCX5222285.1 hypothetical protein [Streptomyces sp. NBC_00264]
MKKGPHHMAREKMMTRRGMRRYNCCPGHNLHSYRHGRERAREDREWRQDIGLDLPHNARGPFRLP